MRYPPRSAFAYVVLLCAIMAGANSDDVAVAQEPAQKPAGDEGLELYQKQVRPLLREKCFSCHSDHRQEPLGSLRLDRREGWLTGGDRGAAVVPGKPDESLLIQAVERRDDLAMPPEQKLVADEVTLLRKWVEMGAPSPEIEEIDPEVATARWAFAELRRPGVPLLNTQLDWPQNDVDHFILDKLHASGLAPSPQASRRTLIRRLSFDLVGLPPTPEEIAAFEQDQAPLAYERLVERLLASPRYGERWARHWLDVVHFGETHGYDKDQPRPNAWPYRDYVIRALNADKPLTRFIEEQIAGDAFYPHTRDGVEALGFLSAGPWDFIGHAEVPETKIDGKIARHLDRDDVITTVMQSFCGLTVQCAQCHDHKFDPISQTDYYSLQAVFAAIDRTHITYDVDVPTAKKRAELLADEKRDRDVLTALTERVRQKAGEPYIAAEKELATLQKPAGGEDPRSVAYGWHSNIEPEAATPKWVQVDLGTSMPLASIVLQPCRDEFNGIGEGFGFPKRLRVEISDDPAFDPAKSVTVLDRTNEEVANPKLSPVGAVLGGQRARYIRVTAVQLAPRMNDFIFSLAELQAFDSEGRNVAAGAVVTSFDSIEALPRWSRTNLTDGWYPGKGAIDRDTELRKASERLEQLTVQALTSEELEERRVARESLAAVQQQLAALPMPSMTYAGGVHSGNGAFRGTGPDGGKPRTIHLLRRGNVLSPGPEMQPASIALFEGLKSHFDLPPEHQESQRRVAMARWIADRNNPLTWRTMANRLWHYHFGVGLAATPNDLGRGGQRPSHPELLDWLACELRDGLPGEEDSPELAGSLKKIHRLLVCSATYRQTSDPIAAPSAVDPRTIDANNRLLWRMPRKKLEAEAIRDAVLATAGLLDLTMGGPSFQDFIVEKPEHSPHYQYHLHDPDDRKSHRRAVYRFTVRSQQQPFMRALDCADPSMQVDRRIESLSPQQALAMVNDRFMLVAAKRWAEQLDRAEKDLRTATHNAFTIAFGRSPDEDELNELAAYAAEHGLANMCRVLYSLNEFSYVD
jgi:hypothetical protein